MSIYGTLAASKTYHSERGNTAWADGADADLTIALQRGTEFIDHRFIFSGFKVDGRDQVREWPRFDVIDREGFGVDSTTVPVEIEKATYEAALRELASPGSLTPDVTLTKQVKRQKVEGAVEVEFTGALGVEAQMPIITIINGILAPIMRGVLSNLSGSTNRV